MRHRARLVLAAPVMLAAACARDEAGANAPWFAEEAAARGLVFEHESGARGAHLMPEIMSGGAALFDMDGDGDLDAYLVQSGALEDPPEARPPNQLFENTGSGRFADVTATSGAGDRGIGMGVACGDADGDGDPDLYVTNLGPNTLLSNSGGGRFEDTTARAGVGHAGWGSSAAFFDADLDGDLDLWGCNYLNWIPAAEHDCTNRSGAPDYCDPKVYQAPALDVFYLNRGGGEFDDATAAFGVDVAGTSLGIACVDADDDGWLDVFVANDGMPGHLWRNRSGTGFEEIGRAAGCAVDLDGAVKAGMGVAAGDLDDDGDTDLLVCNLDRESDSYFENRGGRFADRTSAVGLRVVSRSFTRFGTGWQDFDQDGFLDLFQANGRVMRLHPAHAADPYAEPNLLLRGRPGTAFEEVLPRGGTAEPLVATSRAAAFGDVDGDGAVDVLVVNRDGPAHLLVNRAPRRGHWLAVRAIDSGGDALHARLTVRVGDRRVTREVRTAYSYQAASTSTVHLGLGDAERVERVEVRWPDGAVEEFGPFEADRAVELVRTAPRQRPAAGPISTRAEFEAIAQRLREGRNEYFGRAQVDALRSRVQAPGIGAEERVQNAVLLAKDLLRLGEVGEAQRTIDAALAEVESDPALSSLRVSVHRARGLAYLRAAEVANCIDRHAPECCILPLAGGGVHALRGPAEEALRSYLVCAEAAPGDISVRWLLNVAAMALGEWPGGVAEQHLIPPSAFEPEAQVGRFEDVAPRLGLDTFNLCGGMIVEDFDGDGLLDVLTSTWDPSGPLHFFVNRGDGGFEERSAASGLDQQLGGLNCIGADYDGDGDVDALVLRGAWLREDGEIRNSLLQNDGAGAFEDVTRRAGLALPARPTQAAAFGDFDGDGALDLYVGNESRRETMPGAGDHPSQLFLSDRRGAFSDVAASAGVTNDRYAKGVAAGDFDNDGDLDLYVSNLGANRLYSNGGAATFADVAPELGVTEPAGRSFAPWFFDQDNDGWLDLFVGGFDAKLEDVVASMLGRPHAASNPRLYRNEAGRFRDATAELGLLGAFLPMGSNFGDVNGDGWLDIYLATGNPDYEMLVPNVLLVNDGGRRYLDATTAAGLGHLQKGQGVAFADLDHDGDQDLVHQLGGFYPGDGFANAVFLNPGHGGRFLVVELEGVESNRAGYGTRLKVTVDSPAGTRELFRAAGSVSSFGGSPLRQEIGLGDATRIVALEVRWPTTGLAQVFSAVPLDAHVRVTEGRNELELLQRLPIPIAR